MNPIFEPQAQDLAMATFREAFDTPLIRCHVVKDGKLMRFRLSSDRLATQYWLKANHVIAQQGLPLTAEIDEWKVSGVVFDRWLVIEFDASKLPVCY
jgi:hypothetical protein